MQKEDNKVIMGLEKKISKLFHAACAEYELLCEGDKVLVALSGGKDSMMLLRLLAHQQRILKPRISVEAIHIVIDSVGYVSDTGYLHEYCRNLGVKLHVIHGSFVKKEESKKPMCFICSWIRRKEIFSFAEREGFNKVAFGHHQDDVIVTLLMNMFYEGSIQTMPPILKMKYYNISLIRPMCKIPESLIKKMAEYLEFRPQSVKCPFEKATHRKEVEDLLRKLESDNSEIRYSLWSSMKNIRSELLP